MKHVLITALTAAALFCGITGSAEEIFSYDFSGKNPLEGKIKGSPALTIARRGGSVKIVNGEAILTNTPGEHKVGSGFRIPKTAGKLNGTTVGDEITVAMLVKPAKFGSWMGLAATSTSGHKAGWMFGIAAGGELQITVGGAFGRRVSKEKLKIGEWNHVVFTWKVGSPYGISFYLNGKPAPLAMGYVGKSPAVKGGEDWYIGTNPGQYQPFCGSIRAIRVFDEVLTPAAVTKLSEQAKAAVAPAEKAADAKAPAPAAKPAPAKK